MKVKALANKVIARLLKAPEMSPGGIYLAPREESYDGELLVVSIGKNMKKRFREGMVILVNKGTGAPFDLDGESYRVLTEDQILAIEFDPEDKKDE